MVNVGTGLVGKKTHCGTMTCLATTYSNGVTDCDNPARSNIWFDQS